MSGKAFGGKTLMQRLSKLNNRFDCLTSTKINLWGSLENFKSLSSSDAKFSEINKQMSSA